MTKKRIFLVIMVALFIALAFLGWRLLFKGGKNSIYPVAVGPTQKKTLSADEYNKLKIRYGELPAAHVRSKAPSALPQDVQRSIETVNDIQKINKINEINRRK